MLSWKNSPDDGLMKCVMELEHNGLHQLWMMMTNHPVLYLAAYSCSLKKVRPADGSSINVKSTFQERIGFPKKIEVLSLVKIVCINPTL